MFYLFSSVFFFFGEKVSENCFRDDIISSRQDEDGIKFAQNVALSYVKEKKKPQWNFSKKVFNEKDGYDPFIDISTFPTVIKLEYFLGGIHHCVTVVGK